MNEIILLIRNIVVTVRAELPHTAPDRSRVPTLFGGC